MNRRFVQLTPTGTEHRPSHHHRPFQRTRNPTHIPLNIETISSAMTTSTNTYIPNSHSSANIITPTTTMSTIDASSLLWMNHRNSSGDHHLEDDNDAMMTTTTSSSTNDMTVPKLLPIVAPSTPMATSQHPHNSTSSAAAAASFVDLYVVQKCWYSGPQIATPTIDYMRLLRDPQEAEQIAYHSAHLFATATAAAASTNQNEQPNHQHNIVVRTISLPATSKSDNSSLYRSTHHAFVAAGQLFWIRRIKAQIVNHHQHPPQQPQEFNFDHAHCIVTDGIVGGTGFNVRRRQFDEDAATAATQPIRVFVGSSSSHAALQLVVGSHHQQQNHHPVPVGSTVQWIPVGSPPSPPQILNEWSPKAHMAQQQQHNAIMMDDQNGVTNPQNNENLFTFSKRTIQETDDDTANGTVWFQPTKKNTTTPKLVMEPVHNNNDPFIWRPVVSLSSSLLLSRPTKRPCCRTSTTTTDVHHMMTTTATASTTTTNSFEPLHPSVDTTMMME